MNVSQHDLAKNYLAQKEQLLNDSLTLTQTLMDNLGDREKTTDLLRKRKALLMQLEQLDQSFSHSLADYAFDEADLYQLGLLAEKLWLLDDQITKAMQQNKAQILQSLNH